jgi:hypothetical protein
VKIANEEILERIGRKEDASKQYPAYKIQLN